MCLVLCVSTLCIKSFRIIWARPRQVSSLSTDEAFCKWVITWEKHFDIIKANINLQQMYVAVSLHVILTQSRVHFRFTFLDFVFSGAAAVADASPHLLVSVCLRAVCQTVTRLPAVKTQLRREKHKENNSMKGPVPLITLGFLST